MTERGAVHHRGSGRGQLGQVLALEQRDRPRARFAAAVADPKPLPGGNALVQPVRVIPLQPAGQHRLFPQLGGDRQALQGLEHRRQPVGVAAAGVGVQALPAQQEIGELRRRTGDDLLPQQGQRAALHLFQVRRDAPLHRQRGLDRRHRHGAAASGPLLQLAARPTGFKWVAGQNVGQAHERMGVEEAQQNRLRRGGLLLGRRGQHAKRPPIVVRLLGEDPARRRFVARQGQPHRAAVGLQLGEEAGHRSLQLGRGQVAESAQVLRHLRRRPRRPAHAAQPALDQRHRARMNQPLLVRAEQLIEQLRVEIGPPARRGLGAVVLVHVLRGEREQHFLREWRRPLQPARRHFHRAGAQVGEELLQFAQVHVVLQAFAEGLDHDREIGVLARHLEQVAAAQPLEPERRPLADRQPRQQQRPRRVLAEPQGEQGAVGQLQGDALADVLRRQAVENVQDRLRAVGQADQQAVVVVQDLRGVAEPLVQPVLQRQPQTQVDAMAQRAEHQHLPVAELVARRLDHDAAVGGHHAGAVALAADVLAQVLGRGTVEVEIVLQPLQATRVFQLAG